MPKPTELPENSTVVAEPIADVSENPALSVSIRLLTDAEINGIKVKVGRVIAVDESTALDSITAGFADNDQSAIDYALTENPEIITL